VTGFVALGDSFTEGLDDALPDGTFRGWADLVAARLARDDPEFRYANLAVRGRLLGRIVSEQVPAAVALRPQIVSIAGGTNDILRRTCDVQHLVAIYQAAIGRLCSGGERVIVFTGTDPTRRLPSTRRLMPRVMALNDAVVRSGREHGALVVDLFAMPQFDDPRLWSRDRLHLSAAGHALVAAAVLRRLGITEVHLPDTAHGSRRPPWVVRRASDARWAGQYAAPWVYRRLTRRSSGDVVTAKRPTPTPVTG
jgi:lysophospholipase L1-like esterase